MIMTAEDDFDLTIGRLDRIISKLVSWSKSPLLTDIDRQTLKYHAEDMCAAGSSIIRRFQQDEDRLTGGDKYDA